MENIHNCSVESLAPKVLKDISFLFVDEYDFISHGVGVCEHMPHYELMYDVTGLIKRIRGAHICLNQNLFSAIGPSEQCGVLFLLVTCYIDQISLKQYWPNQMRWARQTVSM